MKRGHQRMVDGNPCPEDWEWMAYADGELAEERSALLSAHRDACPVCRTRLRAASELLALADEALLAVEPPAKLRPRTRGRRPLAWVASGVAAAVLLTLALPRVRTALAAAAQAFQIQHVQAVPITPSEVAQVTNALTEHGRVTLRHFGSVDVSEHGTSSTMNPTDLPTRAGLPDLWPTGLGAQVLAVVEPARTMTFRFHIGRINALIESLGATQLFPEALDNRPFRLTLPPMAVMADGLADGNTVSLTEMGQPTLAVPAGVSLEAVRAAILNLPFLPPNLAQAVSSVGNWRDTLVVPLPGHPENIRFLGHPAILESDNQDHMTALIWIQQGIIVAFSENGTHSVTPPSFVAEAATLFAAHAR
jgi:hypothetical protein